jgi:hypothetical protein
MLWPLGDAGQQLDGGRVTSTSLLTTVTASTTTHTKGAWAQMIAATTFEASWLQVHLGQTGVAVAASNSQTLLDVGVGASGSEQVVVPNIAIGGSLPFASWLFPLVVPSGSRIALRIQSAVASKNVTAGVMVMGGGMGLESGSRATTYGAATATSIGTVLAAPTVVNTAEGAWTVISASTTNPMRWLVVGISAPNTATASIGNALVDVGVGASLAESTVISDIAVAITGNEDVNHHRPLTFPVSIPAGSRLVARYRGTSTSTASSPTVTLTGID